MEIFQTIWMLLTSENTILFKIFAILCSGIEIYLYALIIGALLNINITKKQYIIYVFSLLLVAFLSQQFIPSPYYTFINVLSIPIFAILIFKANILKSIGALVLIYALSFFITIIIMIFVNIVLDIPSHLFETVLIYKLIIVVPLYLSYYVFYKCCKKYNIHIIALDKIKKFKLISINLVVGIMAVGMQYLVGFLYFDYLPTFLNIFSQIILLVYFVLSIFSLYRTSKLELTTQLLEQEKQSNKHLSTLHDNIRGFKHDFNNIIQAVGGYLATDNIVGLKTYYKELLEECQINNNLSVLNPEIINNPAIYSLLSDKYYKSEELGIKLNLEIFADLSNLNITSYELTRILGILLDNAIEASAKCDKKIVNIIFRKDKNLNRNLIIIENTYINKDVNLNKIFDKGFSSKEENEDKKNHGIGLWEVKKYIHKRDNLNLYTTKNEEFFSQQFEIYD